MGSCCSGATARGGDGGAHGQSYTTDTEEGEGPNRQSAWSPELWYVTMQPNGHVDLARRRLRASKLAAPPSPALTGSPTSARRSARQPAADTLSRSSTNTSFSAGSSGAGRNQQQQQLRGSGTKPLSSRRRYYGSAIDGSENEVFRNVLQSGSQSHISDFDSDGRLTAEPWALVLATREAAAVLKARIKYDITAAIDQFEVPPEHPQVLASSIRKSEAWLPDSVSMAKTATPQTSSAVVGGDADALLGGDAAENAGFADTSLPEPLTPCHEEPRTTESPAGRSPRLRSMGDITRRGGGGGGGPRARRAPLTVDSLEMHSRLLQWSEVDAKHNTNAHKKTPPTRTHDR